MSATGEIIKCFDESECVYKACPLFNEKTDNCKLWKLFPQTKEPSPEMDIPEREEKSPANPMYDYPPTREDLEAVLGKVFDTDLEYLSTGTVTTRKFLKDTWKGYDDKLVELGYGYYSDKPSKTYEWRFGYKKDEAPKKSVSTPTNSETSQTQLGGARLISSLKEGEKSSKDNPLNIKGTLTSDPIQKDVNTSRGPATVTSAYIKDDSGEAKITFWGDDGNEVMDFVTGDKLFFEGLFVVNAPYDGKPQIVGGKYYKVAKLN